MRNHASNIIQDPSIWDSYRRAALRSKISINGNTNSRKPLSLAPVHQLENNLNIAVAKLEDAIENDAGKDMLRSEIKRLKRLVRKKDLMIDLLMEKIVRLQRLDISARDEVICNEHLRSTDHPSSPSAISLDVSCDSAQELQRKCSISSVPSVTSEDNYFVKTAGTQSKPTVKSEKVFIRKYTKNLISERHEGHSRRVSGGLEVLNTDDSGCSPCQNDTFVLHGSSEMTRLNTESKTKDEHIATKFSEHSSNQDFCTNPKKFNRNIFVIESFSSSSEDSHPDWKAPLPPSVCLRKNRPEIIKRIEHRQIAINVAANLRRRVTEEKMKAARDVVQGRRTVNNVRKSLMLDPTRITAFPTSEMINLTRRRLRESNVYKAEVSGGKKRVDIAASKIIAHTFSETTRRAVLESRSFGC